MTSVLLTIDTELSPGAHARGVSPFENFSTAILGRTRDGEWGIGYQIDMLNAHRLKGIFFVEALSAAVCGQDLLKRTVESILAAGHEVQLHLHTEWLAWHPHDPVGGRRGRCMADFGYDDQCRLLEIGIESLVNSGAPVPIAFRAGNYGANNDTLRACARIGLRFDSSYNYPYLSGACRIVTAEPLCDATTLDGVIEVPIAFFVDMLQHVRPAQICANSLSELRLVIEQSVAHKRQLVPIVSHSFELLNRARTRANRLLVRRFERFCKVLDDFAAVCPTAGFRALGPSSQVVSGNAPCMLRSHIGRTGVRLLEQAFGTIAYG